MRGFGFGAWGWGFEVWDSWGGGSRLGFGASGL